MVRYPANRWVRKMMTATTQGPVAPGEGAKRTWLKDISLDIEKKHATVQECMDRKKWKEIVQRSGPPPTLNSNNPSLQGLTIQQIQRARGRKRQASNS